MKVAVLTDVHANLPALRAALDALDREGYDLLVHLGDAVAIGPFPAECPDVLLGVRDSVFIKGNHDEWFAFGLPRPRPAWMSEGEARHQAWAHGPIDPGLCHVAARWPWWLRFDFEGTSTAFVHYPLDASGRKFAPFMANPRPADLDEAFTLFPPPRPRSPSTGTATDSRIFWVARVTSTPLRSAALRPRWPAIASSSSNAETIASNTARRPTTMTP